MATMASVTLRKTHNGGRGRPQQWRVVVDRHDVGLLERYRGDTMPYHAFAGIGREARHVGAFYPDGVSWSVAKGRGGFAGVTLFMGGKDAAIAAVLAVANVG